MLLRDHMRRMTWGWQLSREIWSSMPLGLDQSVWFSFCLRFGYSQHWILQHVSSRLQPVKDCSVGNTLINPEAMSKDISDFIFLISSAINHFHLWNHMFVKLKGEIYFWYKVYNNIPFILIDRQHSIIVPITQAPGYFNKRSLYISATTTIQRSRENYQELPILVFGTMQAIAVIDQIS